MIGENDCKRQEFFNRWGIWTQSHYSLYTNLDKDAQQEFSQEFETFTETLSQNRRIFIGRRNFNFWACIFRLVPKEFDLIIKEDKKDIYFIITEMNVFFNLNVPIIFMNTHFNFFWPPVLSQIIFKSTMILQSWSWNCR